MRAADACLYHAILHVRRNIESPGSDKWISTDATEMYALVLIAMVQEEHWPHHAKPPSLNEVVSAWTRFRKASDHKAVLLCELIKKHGTACFWSGRVDGECSEDLTIDRLVPGKEYSLRNCVVACSYHNSKRSNETVEEFLSIEMTGLN